VGHQLLGDPLNVAVDQQQRLAFKLSRRFLAS
jgi:hypothetical protein